MATKSGKRSTGRTAGISKRQRRKGTVYEVRYRANESGVVRQRARTFATEDEAKAFLATVKHQVQTGDYIDPALARKTWATVAAEWQEQKATSGKKQRTLRGHGFTLTKWCSRWDDQAISSVTYADVQGLINEMVEAGRRPQTVRNVFNVVRGVLDYAVDAGYIRSNPAVRLRKHLPKGQTSEPRYLTAAQVETLASSLRAPHDLFVRLAAWSGLRAGELAGLRVNRVDVLRSRITVAETVVDMGKEGLKADTPKSAKSNRTVPIPPALARQVAAHIAAAGLGPDDYVFGVAGQPHDHDEFYRHVFVPATEATGLAPLRMHDLRHTYASLMHAQGRSMLEVSRWMGHSTYRLTADTYSHLWDGEDGSLNDALDAAFLAATAAPSKVTAMNSRRTG
jgi:integrase